MKVGYMQWRGFGNKSVPFFPKGRQSRWEASFNGRAQVDEGVTEPRTTALVVNIVGEEFHGSIVGRDAQPA